MYLLLSALAVVTVFPFLWLLATSLGSRGAVFAFPPALIPHPATLANFAGVWRTMPVGRFFANTVYSTGMGLVLTLLVSARAGYPVARMRSVPAIEIHLIESPEPPTGVGEVSVPSAAPALTNAIAALTGTRIRQLPINNTIKIA